LTDKGIGGKKQSQLLTIKVERGCKVKSNQHFTQFSYFRRHNFILLESPLNDSLVTNIEVYASMF
jgi:hypothetical protein